MHSLPFKDYVVLNGTDRRKCISDFSVIVNEPSYYILISLVHSAIFVCYESVL